MSKIALIMAMHSEAKPLIEQLNLKQDHKAQEQCGFLPFKFFQGTYQGNTVTLTLSGQCKEFTNDNICCLPASIQTLKTIEIYNPDLVLNAGTAGGFSSLGANIGDVYLVNSTSFHDRRIPLPGFKEYGNYKRIHEPNKYFNNVEQFKQAGLSTGNSLDMPPMDEQNIRDSGAVLKDMEGAAIAWLAHQYNKPLILVKSVTDIVDGDVATSDEFLANLSLASKNLAQAVTSLLGQIRK